MSYAHVTAIRANRGLSPTQKLVALMVADHIGAEGCWASVPTIAAECGLSVRATQTTLRDLVCCGAITRSGVRTVAHGAVVVYGWGLVEVETTHKGCSRCTGAAASPVQDVHRVQDVHPTPAAGAPVGVQDVHPWGAAGAPKPPHGTTPSEPPHGTTPETHASQPAAEETAWAPSSSRTPSVGPAATCSPSQTLPPSAAGPVESASIAPPATTAHPVTVAGRPPVAGSGDDALAVAWAQGRMQRLDATRIHLPQPAVRAIRAAVQQGATLDDLRAIGAWLETPAAEWWQAKGYAVDGWRQLVGADGAKWRERLRDAQAREPVRAGGRVTATQAGAGFADALRRLIDDEQGEIIDISGGYDGEQGRDREGVRAVATGGPGSPRRLVDGARAGG